MQRSPDLVERERLFYNSDRGSYRRWRRLIWRAVGPFNRNEELHQLYDPRGKRVLLYGCGAGAEARRLTGRGAASVTGIDISDAEIAQARWQAAVGGYAAAVEFRTADAHATGFPDGSFDLIVGNAILHHLDLPLALGEIRRILAPGGRAVFLEPLGHNPMLRLARRLTPAARTVDERPFTVDDWQLCADTFPAFEHRELELTSLALLPLAWMIPHGWRPPIARLLTALDDRLLGSHPRLRPYARTSLLILDSGSGENPAGAGKAAIRGTERFRQS